MHAVTACERSPIDSGDGHRLAAIAAAPSKFSEIPVKQIYVLHSSILKMTDFMFVCGQT